MGMLRLPFREEGEQTVEEKDETRRQTAGPEKGKMEEVRVTVVPAERPGKASRLFAVSMPTRTSWISFRAREPAPACFFVCSSQAYEMLQGSGTSTPPCGRSGKREGEDAGFVIRVVGLDQTQQEVR
jgi:hypothetical protein